MSHKILLFKNKLAIRICINRQVNYTMLPVTVYPEHWSKDADAPKKTHPNYRSLLQYLTITGEDLDAIMNTVYTKRMSAAGAKEIIEQTILGKIDNDTLLAFANIVIKEFEDKKQPGNARWYKIAVDQFLKHNRKDIHLSDLSYQVLLKFKQAKEKDGLLGNSINNYLRAIRALYREAQRREVFKTSFQYPFQAGLIPSQQKTMPRNIGIEDLKKLEEANLGGPMQRAIDFWLIGFYLQGSDFIDIANLTRFNLINGYYCFNRAKTGQPVKVKLTYKLSQRIAKYWNGKDHYILPILQAKITDAKTLEQYQRKLKAQNKFIKRAAAELGITAPLTSKWLRHSWITIAKRLFIEEDVRKQAVGHRSLNGAHAVYADDFTQNVVDAANSLVIGESDIKTYRQLVGHN